jgi:hypothetical protein
MNGGVNVVRHDPANEVMVLNDFQSNVNLVVNGETLTQEQLLNKHYYSDAAFNRMQNNEFVANRQQPSKKIHEIPDEPKPLEPGQVDPAAFFGSSMKGLF